MLVIFSIAIVRFFFLNFGPYNKVHQNIRLKEALITQLDLNYPDKKVFIINGFESDLILEYFPELFIKYESFLMSDYLLDEQKLLFITEDTTTYLVNNEPVFVAFKSDTISAKNIRDCINMSSLDPVREFPKMKVELKDIKKL